MVPAEKTQADRIVYPPVGICIYCLKSDTKLSDEHIIPFALAGPFVLPKSSCSDCANITAKFERTLSRSIFGNFRVRHNLPTRRKEERPTHIEATRQDPNLGSILVPASEHPAPVFLYKCTTAGILSDSLPNIDVSHFWEMVCISSHDELVNFEAKYGKTSFKFRHTPAEFARSLAKIGHSYAVAQLGLGSFTPIATDVILGKFENFSYIVGGNFELRPADKTIQHSLRLVAGSRDFQTAFLICEIRLFANAQTPDYHVVVGTTRDLTETQKLISLLQI